MADSNRRSDPSALRGRVAIVTGGARGIGLATATDLLRCGAHVLLADLDDGALTDAGSSLEGEFALFSGDIARPTAADALVADAVARWGGIDIVVNNAGYNWNSPVGEMSDEQFTAMFDVHVFAPFRILRAAAPHLLSPVRPHAGYRKVVNMSSVSGTMGNPNQVNYASAKAAVVGMTKALAKEWGSYGVTVNAVAPGFIETRLTEARETAGSIDIGSQVIPLGVSSERKSDILEQIPLGRPGSADDVARVVVFLCSPASDYMTGQVISVNGGLTMGMSS